MCASDLASLANAVLFGLQWLLFPITIQGNADGTEDLQVIFERLAQRDATFCKPHRATEFADMGAADFVRNSFRDEATAVSVYKARWLPMEQAAATYASSVFVAAKAKVAATTPVIRQRCPSSSGNTHTIKGSSNTGSGGGKVDGSVGREGGLAGALEAMLEIFLLEQPEAHLYPNDNAAAMGGGVSQVYVGGHLYSRFRAWLTAALRASLVTQEDIAKTSVDGRVTSAAAISDAETHTTEAPLESRAALDEATIRLLGRLHDFALEYFSEKQEESTSAGDFICS